MVTQDLGLEIYFDVFREWAEDDEGRPRRPFRTIVLGYITLPLLQSNIMRSRGPKAASVSTLDASP